MANNKDSDILNIDFVGTMWIWTSLSVFLIIGSLFVIGTKGFNYGIDFAGGAEIQARFGEPVTSENLRAFVKDNGFRSPIVQQLGEKGEEYLVRVAPQIKGTPKEINKNLNKSLEKFVAGLKTKWPSVEIRRVDTVGPQVGSQLKRNGILAAFYSILCILIYVGLRFDYKYAPGAVFCLVHDSVVTLGILSLLGREINVQIMAAVLTIIGYSLNDTIVVYDRIREVAAKFKEMSLPDVINKSVNATLSRTILTSVTLLFAALCLFLYAGGVIEELAFAMIIGIILGTFSSVYVASPLIIFLDKFRKDPLAQGRRKPARA